MIGVMLFTLVECLDCYVVYKNVFGVNFTKKKTLYAAVALLAFVLQGVALHSLEPIWREAISIFIGLVMAILLVEGKRGRAIVLYPVVLLMYTVVNILSSYMVASVLGTHQEILAKSLGWTVIIECTSIVVFSLYGFVSSKRVSEAVNISFWQACAIFSGVFCCLWLIAFAQGVWNADDYIFTIKEEVLSASMVLTVLFIGMLIWQHMARTKVLRVQMENETYRLYLQGQQEHIRMLLEDDERRRRLKHDLRAHMLVLNTYAKDGELDKLQAYLQEMEESFCVEQANRYTGILGVDAIINDIHKKAMEQNVNWSFEGALKENTDITVFEWCTIFSNLLTNALEAVQESCAEKQIQVKISNMQGKVVLFVKNTCSESKQGTDKPKSTKTDKVNHGLGLKNVEEIVKKNGGCIDYNAQGGWFEVSVIL